MSAVPCVESMQSMRAKHKRIRKFLHEAELFWNFSCENANKNANKNGAGTIGIMPAP